MLGQLVLTFIVGSLLYACRRLSGTLLLPIFLLDVAARRLASPLAMNDADTIHSNGVAVSTRPNSKAA